MYTKHGHVKYKLCSFHDRIIFWGNIWFIDYSNNMPWDIWFIGFHISCKNMIVVHWMSVCCITESKCYKIFCFLNLHLKIKLMQTYNQFKWYFLKDWCTSFLYICLISLMLNACKIYVCYNAILLLILTEEYFLTLRNIDSDRMVTTFV